MSPHPRRVVIVGGGVTGLSVAHRLAALARAEGAPPIAITLVEARDALGGNVRTERRDGFVIEGGPDSFVITKPEAAALCRELGLGDSLMPTQPRNRRVYVGRNKKLVPLPEGVVLTIPTRVLPFASTPLFTWRGKARMALDLVIPARDAEDESIGHFVRRRLGAEAVDQLADPLMGGIYAGDIEALSLRSTFPQLLEYERRHGSLIRGALAARRAAPKRPAAKSGAPPSPFLSLRGGMGELVEALAASVRRSGVDVRVGTSVVAIARPAGTIGADSDGFVVRVVDREGHPDALAADDVVVASHAYAAAEALRGLDPELARMLDEIPYLSTGTISLAFEREAVPHRLDAVGLILPRNEGRRILAATFSSSKWEHRAPADRALIRVFVGGHRDPGALGRSDDELVALARDELASLLGIRKAPLFARVFRYDRSNPQPIVGHAVRVERLRGRAAAGLWFGGAAFDGVGIPDCVRQANEIAARIANAP